MFDVQNQQNNATRASANITPVSAESNPRTVAPIRTHEKDKIAKIMRVLPKVGAHSDLLNAIILKVEEVFGPHGVTEFFRGAHMVFNDEDGKFLVDLLLKSAPLAALHNEKMMSKTDAFGSAGAAAAAYFVETAVRGAVRGAVAYGAALYSGAEVMLGIPSAARLTGWDNLSMLGYRFDIFALVSSLTPEQRLSGMMVTRKAGTSETSHYGDPALIELEPDLFQFGVDMPANIGGHILFGKVPGKKQVFIQSEGAGFQTLTASILEHGMGAFWSIVPDKINKATMSNSLTVWQTGMAGCTEASEKNGTHYEQGRDGKLMSR